MSGPSIGSIGSSTIKRGLYGERIYGKRIVRVPISMDLDITFRGDDDGTDRLNSKRLLSYAQRAARDFSSSINPSIGNRDFEAQIKRIGKGKIIKK